MRSNLVILWARQFEVKTTEISRLRYSRRGIKIQHTVNAAVRCLSRLCGLVFAEKRGAWFMPLHWAWNYRKLVGDVYNCCGFNPYLPPPLYAASRGLLQRVSQAIRILWLLSYLSNYIVLLDRIVIAKLNEYTETGNFIFEMFPVVFFFFFYIA